MGNLHQNRIGILAGFHCTGWKKKVQGIGHKKRKRGQDEKRMTERSAGVMEESNRAYREYVAQLSEKSPLLKNTALAFLTGGGICAAGQLIQNGWCAAGLDRGDAGTMTAVTLIFLSVLLTGLNLYNKLARYGGAGTLVPITGFANAVAAPAIDFRSED